MTPADFQEWLASPSRQEPVEYFRGYLAGLPWRDRPPLAAQVLRLAMPLTVERGGVSKTLPPALVIAQRRHGEWDYSYLAWKRRG